LANNIGYGYREIIEEVWFEFQFLIFLQKSANTDLRKL
jgi:hypothetical protein